MRLTLRQLQIFQAVANLGTTSAAALSIALSQSATSAALSELERALGSTLFDRVGKRLILNDAGRSLLPAARAVLDAAQGIETQFAGGFGVRRDLKVFASTTIGNQVLPRVFTRYRRSHPGTHLALEIGNTRDAILAVQRFATDLGFIEGPCHESDVTVLPWLTDELVIVAGASHPLVSGGRGGAHGGVDLQQLMRTEWLLREAGSGTREAVEQALLPYLPNLLATLTLGSSEAIKNAVAAGLGISCLSRAVVDDLVAAGKLVVLRTGLPPLMRGFALIHHRDKVLSESLRGFVAYCLAFERQS